MRPCFFQKLLAAAILAAFSLLPAYRAVSAQDVAEEGLSGRLQAEIDHLDLGDADQVYAKIKQSLDETSEVPGLRDIVRNALEGKSPFELAPFARAAARYLCKELFANLGLLGKLLAVSAASALLASVGDAFGRGESGDSVARLAEAVCMMAVATMALGAFSITVDVARQTIGDITTLMLSLLPTLSALLAAAGVPVTAGLLHPALLMATYSASVLISRYGLPLMMFAAAVEVAGVVSGSFKLSGLTAFLRQVALVVLGISLSLFLGISVVYRAAGGVSDGLALRSAKFLSNALVPMVGKMFSDAVEVVFASSAVLKNAVGVAGAVAVALITVFPLLKVGALILIYKAASILMQPVGSKRVCECIGAVAGSLVTMWLLMLAVSLMGFVSLSVIVGVTRPL